MTTLTEAAQVCAAQVMSRPPLTVEPTAPIGVAWDLMVRAGVRHLIVSLDGRCLGVVDDRVVFAQWPMGPLALRRRRVADVMRAVPETVSPDTSLQAVARLMIVDVVDAVPVVGPDGVLVGVVTHSDLVDTVAHHGVHVQAGQ